MSHRQNIYIILYIDSVKKWEAVLLWLCVHHHMAGISEWSLHAIRDKRLGIITLSLNVCGKPLKQKKRERYDFYAAIRSMPQRSQEHVPQCMQIYACIYIYTYMYVCMYKWLQDLREINSIALSVDFRITLISWNTVISLLLGTYFQSECLAHPCWNNQV